MKKTSWIVGTIIFGMMFVVFSVLSVIAVTCGDTSEAGIAEAQPMNNAIAAFASGVYYTQRVLDPSVNYALYEEWKADMEKARAFFAEAQVHTSEMTAQADGDVLISRAPYQPLSLITTVHAAEAEDIIGVYNTTEKGKRIQALAALLDTDMRTALSALEQANKQVAEHWDLVGDRWAAREEAARIVRSGCKVTVLTAVGIGVGVPAIPFVTPSSVVSIGGAVTAVQLTDDAACIFMGADEFDNCTYTMTAMSAVVSAPGQAVKWLAADSGGTLKTFDAIKDIRNIITDKEFVGLDLSDDAPSMTSGDLNDAVAYAQAKRDAETLLDEIKALQNRLEQSDAGEQVSPPPEPTSEPTPDLAQSSQDFSALEGQWKTLSFYMVDETSDPYGQDPTPLLQQYSHYQAAYFTINPDGTVDWIDVFGKTFKTKIEAREDGIYLQMRTDGAEWRRLLLHENGYLYIDYYSATYGNNGGLVHEAYDNGYRYKIAFRVD